METVGKRFALLGAALLVLALCGWARGGDGRVEESSLCASACCTSAACACCEEEGLAPSGCGETLWCGAPLDDEGHASPLASSALELGVVACEPSLHCPAEELPRLRATGSASRWSSRRPAPEPGPPRTLAAQA